MVICSGIVGKALGWVFNLPRGSLDKLLFLSAKAGGRKLGGREMGGILVERSDIFVCTGRQHRCHY